MSTSRYRGWRAHRHALWWAFLVHRVSGLALLLFLPLHFHVLALAIRDAARFDGFLAWTTQAPVKLAEALLIGLLTVHLAGGLRLLALEFLPWVPWQKNLAAVCFALGVAGGLG